MHSTLETFIRRNSGRKGVRISLHLDDGSRLDMEGLRIKGDYIVPGDARGDVRVHFSRVSHAEFFAA
jgi:hypothetical protein